MRERCKFTTNRYAIWITSSRRNAKAFYPNRASKSIKLAFFAFFKLTKMAKKYIFGKIFFFSSIHYKINFHLICHMIHVRKSTKLAFFAFLTKNWKKNFFGKIFFFSWIHYKISFHLICHMVHVVKSPKLAIFVLKNGFTFLKNWKKIISKNKKKKFYVF